MRRVRARGLQETRTGYQGLPGDLPAPTRTYRVASDGGKDQAVQLMVTKGVIPSFQGCRRCQDVIRHFKTSH